MMKVERYVILNEENKIVNIVLWNGNLETWQPPEECTYALESEVDLSQFEWAE